MQTALSQILTIYLMRAGSLRQFCIRTNTWQTMSNKFKTWMSMPPEECLNQPKSSRGCYQLPVASEPPTPACSRMT
eukprot:945967-Karenia_brevis.AAC.1